MNMVVAVRSVMPDAKWVWSRLDAGSSMPKAAKRVQELWRPNSPYRR